jgi:hypothetical protein
MGRLLTWVRLFPTKSTRTGWPATIGMGSIGGPTGGRVEASVAPAEADPPEEAAPPQLTEMASSRQHANLAAGKLTQRL